VGKQDEARQPTYENITRRMRIACWITEVTDTHSEYVIKSSPVTNPVWPRRFQEV